MAKGNTISLSDFAGFLDGFEARNLATLQRDLAPQIADMDARLAVLSDRISADTKLRSLSPTIVNLEKNLHGDSFSVIDRLVSVGTNLSEIAIKNVDLLKSSPGIIDQLRGFVRTYLDAAEVSRNDRLVSTALNVGNTFKDLPVSSVQ